MNAAIILLLALQAPPTQVTNLAIKDRGAEVKVNFAMPKEPRMSIMQVFHRDLIHVGTHVSDSDIYGQILKDEWSRDPQGLPEEDKNLWKVDVTLGKPGLYEVVLGKEKVRVRVSRSDFKTWRKDLETLQEMTARVQSIAERMDEAHSKHQWKVIQKLLDEDVRRERDKLDLLKTTFTASPRGVKVTLDLLRYHVMEIKILPGEKPPTAVAAAMRGLKEFVDQEATVRLVDELVIALGHKEKGEYLVNRWASREAALQAVIEACKETPSGLALESILKAATEKSEEDPSIILRLKALRSSLVP